MDKDRQLFPRDSLDDDIDQLINNSFSISSDQDTQFIAELRQVYKEDSDSLTRVWKRIERYSRQQNVFQEPSAQTSQTSERLAAGSQIVPLKKRSRNTNYPTSQLFTVLAATIAGIFLVSSLAWVLATTHSATPGGINHAKVGNVVELTVHNDTSGQTNYLTLTYTADDGVTKDHVICQAIPPLDWVDVQSSPGVPTQIPIGQSIWLRYYHSSRCNPSSQFMAVSLPIPEVPVYNHCWFNPDNTTTPNWSGCVSSSQTLPIYYS